MGIRVEVEFESTLGELADELIPALLQGENLAAEHLLGLSLQEVPFDQGTLSSTGAVERATDPEEGAAVTFDTPYAAYLHKHPEFNFQNGRKGKYLEDPALEHKEELGAIIAAQVTRG